MTAIRRQMLRSVDNRLNKLREFSGTARETPKAGWLKTLREALGITTTQLGARLDVTPQAVHELEASERRGSISLESLRRAARALDADVIYVVIPRQSLQKTLEARARLLAERHFEGVARSMRLEQQGVTRQELDEQINDYARSLMNRPRELWR